MSQSGSASVLDQLFAIKQRLNVYDKHLTELENKSHKQQVKDAKNKAGGEMWERMKVLGPMPQEEGRFYDWSGNDVEAYQAIPDSEYERRAKFEWGGTMRTGFVMMGRVGGMLLSLTL